MDRSTRELLDLVAAGAFGGGPADRDDPVETRAGGFDPDQSADGCRPVR